MERTIPRLLALDPATKCGYAYIDIAQPPQPGLKALRHQAGLWDLSKDRFQSQGMRYIRLEKNLYEVEPDFVIFEEVSFPHKSTAAAQMYHGCVAVIQTFCERNGIYYATATVSDIKKRATGKGNVGKEPVILAANEFFQIEPALSTEERCGHDNIADAMWLLQYAIETYAAVVKMRDPERAKDLLNVTGSIDDDSVKKPKVKVSGEEPKLTDDENKNFRKVDW